ncbi:long-chain acyl-CoA synthetase [Krasilnikovia cinnamomea]|uniref:Long-chain acyl-CoA synthetase n=1 Tax=Krasilnikovia cinnamomea TaxID=349313 RepID=A0A4Q7ZJC6_9ACTN|nr:long-chain acyl-CoA synthetase [Krasilnikovia cinnamomea]
MAPVRVADVPDSGLVQDDAHDPVRAAAARRPDGPALIAGEATLTWQELDARVDEAARRLWALCPRPGARVALVLGNTLDFAVTFYGVLRAGLVAVPLNPGYTDDELTYALGDAGAAVVVAEQAVRDRLSGDAVVVPPELPAADGPGAAPATPRADEVAVLLYTSGTSGRPKGAMLSHAALAANHHQLDRIDPPVVGPDDVVLLAVPLFHAYGLNTGLGTVAHHGACGVLVDKFDPAGSLATIARHGVTVTLGVPSMYAAWSRHPEAPQVLAGLRAAVCGAAPLDPADAARFQDASGVRIIVGYGLTETAPVLTTTAVGTRHKTGSIGRPLPGVSLLLRTADGAVLWRDGTASVDEDLAELDLAVADSAGTDPGEIVVRGPNLFAGYWPDGHGGPDADGWWGTGDVAYADSEGDLVLVDRIGELILVNGFNVYPAEIERVLAQHPAVAEAAVIAAPDPETGQAPHAFVVPAADPPPTAEELREHCARWLARFKLPKAIDLVAELPHSPIGKVRKSALS